MYRIYRSMSYVICSVQEVFLDPRDLWSRGKSLLLVSLAAQRSCAPRNGTASLKERPEITSNPLNINLFHANPL